MAEDLHDRLAGKLSRFDLLRCQLAQQRLLPGIGLGLDTGGERLAQYCGQVSVGLARVTARARSHLGGQQGRDQPVFVSRPDRAVAPQERSPRALLATKA
ncbi:hypothetical protein D3C81_1515630 [compost metagenome]